MLLIYQVICRFNCNNGSVYRVQQHGVQDGHQFPLTCPDKWEKNHINSAGEILKRSCFGRRVRLRGRVSCDRSVRMCV